MTLGHANDLAQATAGERHACGHRWVVRPDGRGEDCARCGSCRLSVHLAEIPADALEVLVDRGGILDAATITAAVEHPANEIHVRNGLALLRDLGLATMTFEIDSTPRWCATDAGHDTIAQARALAARRAHELALCEATGHEWTPFRGGHRCSTCGTDRGAPAGQKGERDA